MIIKVKPIKKKKATRHDSLRIILLLSIYEFTVEFLDDDDNNKDDVAQICYFKKQFYSSRYESICCE